MKSEATHFVEEMLHQIRRDFYPAPRWGEKRFYQDRQTLIEAITWPANWMKIKDRCVNLAISDYRRILNTVTATIKRHGKQVKFRRFSLYFFKAVQEHMDHHGDQYYYAAKVRPVSAILPAVTRDAARRRAFDQTTDTLAQINRLVRSPGGRRRRDSGGSEADLFSSCKRDAPPVQDRGNDSQTFAVPAKKRPELLTPRTRPSLTGAADS